MVGQFYQSLYGYPDLRSSSGNYPATSKQSAFLFAPECSVVFHVPAKLFDAG
jgi:hypothetical protein